MEMWPVLLVAALAIGGMVWAVSETGGSDGPYG